MRLSTSPPDIYSNTRNKVVFDSYNRETIKGYGRRKNYVSNRPELVLEHHIAQ
jgi:hypothetical protein